MKQYRQARRQKRPGAVPHSRRSKMCKECRHRVGYEMDGKGDLRLNDHPENDEPAAPNCLGSGALVEAAQ